MAQAELSRDRPRREFCLSSRELQLAALHPCTIDLDALERKREGAAACMRCGCKRPPPRPLGPRGMFHIPAANHCRCAETKGLAFLPWAATAARGGGAAADGARLLRDAIAEEQAAAEGSATKSTARLTRLRTLLETPSMAICLMCRHGFPTLPRAGAAPTAAVAAMASRPVLTGCNHLFCDRCLREYCDGPRGDVCPECHAPGPLSANPLRLLTPLDAATAEEARAATKAAGSRGAAGSAESAPPLARVEFGEWSLSSPPPAEKLHSLRVCACAGAPCPGSKGGMHDSRTTLTLEKKGGMMRQGVHFCTAGCASAKLKSCLEKPHDLCTTGGKDAQCLAEGVGRCRKATCRVGAAWPGVKLRGEVFSDQHSAILALRKQLGQATVSSQDLPLYVGGHSDHHSGVAALAPCPADGRRAAGAFSQVHGAEDRSAEGRHAPPASLQVPGRQPAACRSLLLRRRILLRRHSRGGEPWLLPRSL